MVLMVLDGSGEFWWKISFDIFWISNEKKGSGVFWWVPMFSGELWCVVQMICSGYIWITYQNQGSDMF